MKRRDERIIKSILGVVDILMLCMAAIIAVGIRFSFDWDQFHVKWYAIGLMLVIVSTITIMYFNKLYDLRYKSWFVQVPKVINSFIYSMLVFFLFSFYIREVSYSRLTLGYFSIAAIILLLGGRYLSMYIIKHMYKKGIGTKRLLCIGINDRSTYILNYLNEHSEFGYVIVGYIAEEKDENIKEHEYIGNIKDYKKILKEEKIDSVIVASSGKECYLKQIIEYCEENYIQAYMIPGILDITSNPVSIGQISTIPLIRFKEGVLSPFQLKMKRVFDLLTATIVFILISPLFLFIMLWIKLTTKGSIFFVQERYGMNGEIIEIMKFRTMIENAEEVLEELIKTDPVVREEYETFRKLKNDPRITKIGKFLRKTSLDELPQLLNIIKGDLSVVGPRAMLLDEIERYGNQSRMILKVHPGLTGLWQVSGRNKLPFSERVRLDMYYVNNWSFGLDIMIILKTIPVVLKRDGAL